MEKYSVVRKVIPPRQLSATMQLMLDEDGDFYSSKIAEIEGRARRLYFMGENVDGDGKHPLELHYFDSRTDSDWYVSELKPNGTAFGYVVLRGDIALSEWGYFNLNEIFSACPGVELDYYTGRTTIEETVNKKYNNWLAQ